MWVKRGVRFVVWCCRKAVEAYQREKATASLVGVCSGLQLGEGVQIKGAHRLVAGRNVVISSGALINCGGMKWSNGRGGVVVGENVFVGPHCVIFGAGTVEIGSNVLISPNVVITSHQHTFLDPALNIKDQPVQFGRVRIEDDVWIGSSVVILPGVTVGRGAVIGAGAVVTQDIPPYTVALGIPARVVKQRVKEGPSAVG